MATKNVKKRNWTFLVYPESAPDNWFDILVESGLKGAVSPLHDKDVNAELGPDGKLEVKKGHFHVLACFDGPTTFNVVKALTDKLNQPIPQPLESVRGAYRYLTHKDNPDKYQYDEAEIRYFGGFSPLDYVEITKSEALEIKRKLMRMIRDARITEYAELCNMLDDSDMTQELDVAVSSTMFFRGYIESMRYIIAREVKGRDG